MNGRVNKALGRLGQGYLGHVVADSRRLASPVGPAPDTGLGVVASIDRQPAGDAGGNARRISAPPEPPARGSRDQIIESETIWHAKPTTAHAGSAITGNSEDRENPGNVAKVSFGRRSAPPDTSENGAETSARMKPENATIIPVPSPEAQLPERTPGSRRVLLKSYLVKERAADGVGEIGGKNSHEAGPDAVQGQLDAVSAECPIASSPPEGADRGSAAHGGDAADGAEMSGPDPVSARPPTAERFLPTRDSPGLPVAEAALSHRPRRRNQTAQAAVPKVQIGSVDVHVVMDQPELPRDRRAEPQPQSYKGSSRASRLYQRRL